RLVVLVPGFQRDAEVEIRAITLGIDRDGAAEAVDRIGGADALFQQQIAEIVVRRRVVGLELERAPIKSLRLADPADIPQPVAEVELGFRRAWRRRSCTPQPTDRLSEFFSAVCREAEDRQGIGI